MKSIWIHIQMYGYVRTGNWKLAITSLEAIAQGVLGSRPVVRTSTVMVIGIDEPRTGIKYYPKIVTFTFNAIIISQR